MNVNSADGRSAATVAIDTGTEGFIIAKGKDGKSGAQLSIDEHGGHILAKGKDGGSVAQLSIDEYGGNMAIFNKDGKNVLQADAADMGWGIEYLDLGQ